jgi:HD-GYP domain-containing protein (c-di-GMP phosphodiesterase class II)
MFSGVSAYIVPNLYKYLNLLYLGNRLKNLAVVDPLTGFYTPRFFLLQLNEKLKIKKDLVFVGLRFGNYKRLILKLNFNQIQSLSRLFGNHLRTKIQNQFKTAIISRISNDTMGIVIDKAGKEEVVTFFRDFVEKAEEVDWILAESKITISLQVCLVHKTKEMTGRSDDVLFQMEKLFREIKENNILVEELEHEVGEERGTKYKDILDFIAYDWEERNKDLEKSLSEILEANKRLDQLNRGTLTALARTIDAKSEWTAGHSERVTQLAMKIGRVLALTPEELDNLYRAGLLHDIGKIGAPVEIIDKAGALTDEEFQILSEHPGIGERILEPLEAYAEVTPMVKQHHEWFNGRGYPDGLSGEEIDIGARIMAVADVYDALTSKRPYRDALDPDRAIEIIKEKSGSHLDPRITEALFKILNTEEKLQKKSSSKAVPSSSR